MTIVVFGVLVFLLSFRITFGQDSNTNRSSSQDDLSVCYPGQNSAGDCWNRAIAQSIKKNGVDQTLAIFKRQNDADQSLSGWCHVMSHEVGHQAWVKTKNIGRAFSLGRSHGNVCASGFFHGVLESAVASIGRQKLERQIPNLCQTFARFHPRSLEHYNCVHGLGHGFLAVAHDKWPEALRLCRLLKTPWERTGCSIGVFMQNVNNEIVSLGHYADFRAADPLYPCDVVSAEFTEGCYVNQSSHLLKIFPQQYDRVMATCAMVPNFKDRSTCFEGIGVNLSGQYAHDRRRLLAICDLAEKNSQDCLTGVARDRVYFNYPFSQAVYFCRQIPKAKPRQDCLRVVTSDERASALANFPTPFHGFF